MNLSPNVWSLGDTALVEFYPHETPRRCTIVAFHPKLVSVRLPNGTERRRPYCALQRIEPPLERPVSVRHLWEGIPERVPYAPPLGERAA